MALKLYSNPDNPLLNKILIVAKYGEVDLQVTPDFKLGQDNKTEEFLKKNPLGKVPVLETEEGTIWESNAIARYVARLDQNTHLLGSNEYENGLVDQWLDFTSGEIDLPAKVWLWPIQGLMQNNQAVTNKAKGDIRNVLDILNKHLEDRTFLVGERITLADITVTTSLLPLFTTVLDPGFRKPFVHVFRWFNTIINQPQVKEVLGEVTFASKMAIAPKAPEESAPKAEKPKKESQPQKPKPVEEKKKSEKKKKEEDESEEEEFKEPPTGPNPLDSLPPTSFNLDEWKRVYSNSDIAVSIPWFWEKFDREGWSLWFSDYKYNDELKQLFMTSNLIGGFLQRLDKLRKYGFGSLLIFGEEGAFEIAGCWLFRGQDVPAEMKDCDDYELYNWHKVDVNNADEKKKVDAYFAWAGDFGGKKFNDQGKVFK